MKTALYVAAGVLLVVIGFPLLAAVLSDAESDRPEVQYENPEYAKRMGLHMVPRARFEECPFLLSYAEFEECLGAPGVPITRMEDLPPNPLRTNLRLWTRHVEDPAIDVYAWVNENDEAMISTFKDGEVVSKYAGRTVVGGPEPVQPKVSEPQ